MHETLLSPIDLGGVTLKNRIIFAPTTLGLSEQEYDEKLHAIAAGGCALIIIGDVPVSKRGRRSLHNKKGFARFAQLCEIAHAHDCKISAQLHQPDSNIKALVKYLPGVITKRVSMQDLRTLLNQEVGPYISKLPEKKVSSITASFGEAALLAREAGFDMVQVHGDRMCGSFSSALFNTRTDAYGGSPEQRARFAIEAVSAVRKAAPDMAIDYKLAIRQENPHYGNAGVLVEELPLFVPLLEAAGVTSFHVTLANHAELSDTIPPTNHPYFAEEGCFLKFCDTVRSLTNLPVCGVGGLTLPDFVESQLESGRIDCAAMSRQLMADPNWPNKVKNGHAQDIRRCIRCNRDCLGGMQRHQGVHCIFDKKEK